MIGKQNIISIFEGKGTKNKIAYDYIFNAFFFISFTKKINYVNTTFCNTIAQEKNDVVNFSSWI